jgi:hypothetical protein
LHKKRLLSPGDGARKSGNHFEFLNFTTSPHSKINSILLQRCEIEIGASSSVDTRVIWPCTPASNSISDCAVAFYS